MNDILKKHGASIGNAIRAHKYELDETGKLHMRDGSGLFFSGAMKVIDYQTGLVAIDGNLVVNEGLNHFLNAALPPTGGYAATTAWYIAPFSGNYTPTATLTAATFASTATEFTDYTASTRLPLVISSAATTQTTGNTGNDAVLTFGAAGPYNVYGAAVISSSAKSATTGRLLAAVRFSSPRLNMAAGDRLGLEYVITAGDAG